MLFYLTIKQEIISMFLKQLLQIFKYGASAHYTLVYEFALLDS